MRIVNNKDISTVDQHKTESSTESNPTVTVLVTGYGPFLDKFPVNSSWSIASSLPSTIPPTDTCPYRINLVVPPKPLRVAYLHVVTEVPKMLSKPDMILHIGLAANRKYYTLERQAMHGPFSKFKDVDGQVFSDKDAEKLFGADCPKTLQPTIDCNDVWKRWGREVKDRSADLRTGTDTSVGLYLCGFIYFVSLNWFWLRQAVERPVLFLHVPDLPKEEDIAQGREVAIGLIKSMVASRKELGVCDPHQAPVSPFPTRGLWDSADVHTDLNDYLS